MLCEVCKKNKATTHIKTVVNGVVTEKYLCPHCAAKDGLYGEFGFNNAMSSMLTSIFGNGAAIPENSGKRCECCGSTFDDIVSSGRLGCSECYSTFFDNLLPYLKQVHGSVKHIGKTITESTAEQEEKPQEETAESLKEQLKKLISQEKFEEAAVIRDKIKALEEDV